MSKLVLHRFIKANSISPHTTVIFNLFVLEGGYKELPIALLSHHYCSLKTENLEKAFNSRQTDTSLHFCRPQGLHWSACFQSTEESENWATSFFFSLLFENSFHLLWTTLLPSNKWKYLYLIFCNISFILMALVRNSLECFAILFIILIKLSWSCEGKRQMETKAEITHIPNKTSIISYLWRWGFILVPLRQVSL